MANDLSLSTLKQSIHQVKHMLSQQPPSNQIWRSPGICFVATRSGCHPSTSMQDTRFPQFPISYSSTRGVTLHGGKFINTMGALHIRRLAGNVAGKLDAYLRYQNRQPATRFPLTQCWRYRLESAHGLNQWLYGL